MVTIHEPAVVLTDLGLAALGAWFAWRLWGPAPSGPLGRAPAVLMAGLAGAAFFGANFHAFFPEDTATLPGRLAWVPVTLSIVVAAAMLLEMALRALVPGMAARIRRAVVAAYAVGFAVTVVGVDESFAAIVRFYVPALLLFLGGATVRAVRQGDGWAWIALGLACSAGAAVLQQLEIAVHPVYFDHNAVYHVVQAAALVVLYTGFRGVAAPPASSPTERGASPD